MIVTLLRAIEQMIDNVAYIDYNARQSLVQRKESL